MFGLGRPRTTARSATPMVGARAAEAAPGTRVYAIGDVHGRLDLLDRLVERILADAKDRPAGLCTLVTLGDYIDRGPNSAAVLDRLIDFASPAIRLVALAGNHEESMLRFLDDISVGPTWLYYGGSETLRSYGVAAPRHADEPATLRRLQDELKSRLPRRHRDFLTGLPASHVAGDYMFVHAGIRPGVPLAAQARDDLLWIRDEFLRSEADHGKVVVHGHTIAPEAELCRNRIGLDTGAFATGRLTCVVLEAASQRLLQT